MPSDMLEAAFLLGILSPSSTGQALKPSASGTFRLIQTLFGNSYDMSNFPVKGGTGILAKTLCFPVSLLEIEKWFLKLRSQKTVVHEEMTAMLSSRGLTWPPNVQGFQHCSSYKRQPSSGKLAVDDHARSALLPTYMSDDLAMCEHFFSEEASMSGAQALSLGAQDETLLIADSLHSSQRIGQVSQGPANGTHCTKHDVDQELEACSSDLTSLKRNQAWVPAGPKNILKFVAWDTGKEQFHNSPKDRLQARVMVFLIEKLETADSHPFNLGHNCGSVTSLFASVLHPADFSKKKGAMSVQLGCSNHNSPGLWALDKTCLVLLRMEGSWLGCHVDGTASASAFQHQIQLQAGYLLTNEEALAAVQLNMQVNPYAGLPALETANAQTQFAGQASAYSAGQPSAVAEGGAYSIAHALADTCMGDYNADQDRHQSQAQMQTGVQAEAGTLDEMFGCLPSNLPAAVDWPSHGIAQAPGLQQGSPAGTTEDNSSLQPHIAVDQLHEAHGSWQGRFGSGSIAALQSLRTLAQGLCVQGLRFKAEVQLKQALTYIAEEGETRASSPMMLVMKAGVMLELADVLMELDRSVGPDVCSPPATGVCILLLTEVGNHLTKATYFTKAAYLTKAA
ncbi:hypothetical protein WJX77_006804 [Trebouxia sp. C0004]